MTPPDFSPCVVRRRGHFSRLCALRPTGGWGNAFGITAGLTLAMARAWGADFEVTTTNNAGVGSYRQAILDSNDNPGPDRIVFNIPGSGVQTIHPGSLAFTEPIVVDGYTQPGARPNTLSNGINAVLLIELAGPGFAGVQLSGGFSTVRGLVINRFINGVWFDSSTNRVAGCFVGTDPSGRNALGNTDGFYFNQSSPGPDPTPTVFDARDFTNSYANVVGGTDPADRNLISGNAGYALRVGYFDPVVPFPPVVDSALLGNFIGTDVTGLTRISAGRGTLMIRRALNFTIGGLEPGAGNIIAISDRTLESGSPNTRILGNHFGVGADGRTSIGYTNSFVAPTILVYGAGSLVEANRIAFGHYGIAGGLSVTLSRNTIYSNKVSTGVPAGSSSSFIAKAAGTLDLSGRIRDQSNAVYRLEFFGTSAPHPSGHGEAEAYLGSTSFTTDAVGEGVFQTSLPTPEPFWPCITFMATRPDGTTSGFFPTEPVRATTGLLIYRQPADFTGRPGTNATFRVVAGGAEPLRYQWRRNGMEIPGATNEVLSFSNLQPGQDGVFTVLLTNPVGSLLSEPATMTLLVNPTFVRPPFNQTAAPGEWVTLSAVVNEFATRPISFGWRSNNVFIASTGPTIDNVAYLTVRVGAVDATYRVSATNAAAPAGLSSDLARISVGADLDQDGLPDAYETANRLDSSDPSDANGDADKDGVPNKQEYLAGTDLQDPLSFLRIERVSTAATGTRLEWRAASGKTYALEYRERLETASWLTLTNLPALSSSQTVVVIDDTPLEQRFYRLVTPRQP